MGPTRNTPRLQGIDVRRALRRLVPCLLLLTLAACGGGGHGTSGNWAQRDYAPPGSADDPWGPYIDEASGRFSVPSQWVRAVMHQESGGHQYIGGRPTTSSSGAMGLMQLMPATYAELEARYGLGPDPYEPHDNIVAGTGYIRQLYDKYGSPGFLAAYNSGPGRLDDYLAGNRSLPGETVDYVNAISPHLGSGMPGGAPVGGAVAYASAASTVRVARARRRGGACVQDVDAAYDPASPCSPAAPMANPAPVALAAAAPVDSNDPATQSAAQQVAAAGPRCPGNPDTAFDAPCPVQAPVQASEQALAPPPPAYAPSYAANAAPALPGYRGAPAGGTPPYDVPPYGPAPPVSRPQVVLAAAHASQVAQYGGWAIQVGAFDSPAQARTATSLARQAAYDRLGAAQSVVQATNPPGHGTLYRARLAGLARATAGEACAQLSSQRIACMVVAPGS